MSNLRTVEDRARKIRGRRYSSSLPTGTTYKRIEYSHRFDGDEYHIDGGCPEPRPRVRWEELIPQQKRQAPDYKQAWGHVVKASSVMSVIRSIASLFV